MSQGFTQPPGGTFGTSSGGFSGGKSGFGGGSSGGFGGSSPSGSSPSSTGGFGQGAPGHGFDPSPTGFSQTSRGASGSGSSRGSSGKSRLRSAPLEWILPGLGLGLVSLGLNAWITFGSLVATDRAFIIAAALAWFLAGIFGVLSIGKYMAEVNERKSSGFYTELPGKRALFIITTIILVIAVVWSAVDIAQWAGKRTW